MKILPKIYQDWRKGVSRSPCSSFCVFVVVGEWFCIAAAMLYAGSIILTDRLSRQDDPLTLGILKVGFVGIFALIASFLTGMPRLPAGSVERGVILMLAVVRKRRLWTRTVKFGGRGLDSHLRDTLS